MGQNKALMPFLGQPLVERILARVKGHVDEIIITTNTPELFAIPGIRVVCDDFPHFGSLGGLYSGLKAASHSSVAVAACDMPFVNPRLYLAEADTLKKNDCAVVLPFWDDRPQPMHAVYRREECLSEILQAIDQDERRVNQMVRSLRYFPFEMASVLCYDPQGIAFINVNSYDEFQAAEQKALALGEKNHQD